MKSTCCRSNPRCSGCPVRVMEAARRHGHRSVTAALLADVLAGRPARPIPASVADALARLDAQRARTISR